MLENKCTPWDKICSNMRIDPEQAQRLARAGKLGLPGPLTAAWARSCPGRGAVPALARSSLNACWGQAPETSTEMDFFGKNTRACLHNNLSHAPSLFLSHKAEDNNSNLHWCPSRAPAIEPCEWTLSHSTDTEFRCFAGCCAPLSGHTCSHPALTPCCSQPCSLSPGSPGWEMLPVMPFEKAFKKILLRKRKSRGQRKSHTDSGNTHVDMTM